MNAPTRPPTHPAPEATVKSYVPHAEGEELELRCQLLKAQEHCAALLGNGTSEIGHRHVQDAYDAAGTLVFRHACTIPQLKGAVDYCRNLCRAAMLALVIEGALT